MRILYAGGQQPLVTVVPGYAFNDLIAAWQIAGELRAENPDMQFIAGEMTSIA